MKFLKNNLQFLFFFLLIIEFILIPDNFIKNENLFTIKISGELMSQKTSQIALFQYHPITFKKILIISDSCVNNKFSIEFESDKPQFYYLSADKTISECYLSPGDYLTLFIDTLESIQNIVWFGTGDIENQFIADLQYKFKDRNLTILQLSKMELDSLQKYFDKNLEEQMNFLDEQNELSAFDLKFYEKFKLKILMDWCIDIHEKVHQLSWISGKLFKNDPTEILLDTLTIDQYYPLEQQNTLQFLYIYLKHRAIKEKLSWWHKNLGPDILFRYQKEAISYHQFVQKSLNRSAYEMIWGRYLYLSLKTRKMLPDSFYLQYIERCNTKDYSSLIQTKFEPE